MEKEGRKKEEIVEKRNERLLKKKFYLDKIGFGFSAVQFINILFSFTGASILLIGIINGLKSFSSTLISTFIKEITTKRDISKTKISITGLVFGFSFIILALAVTIESPTLFAITLLMGAIALTIYGELFNHFLNKYSKNGKISRLSSMSTLKGLLLTAATIIISAGILDLTFLDGRAITITILGYTATQKIYGYLLTFEITALAFILSSYLFAKVKIKQEGLIKTIDYKKHLNTILNKSKAFLKNKYLLVMTFTMIIVSVFQSLMNSFAGIFVYRHFQNEALGGFMNVAVMYAVALVFALLGPYLTSKINRIVGVGPMFVFGTLLMAILPLVLSYNLVYEAVVVANTLSILGAALVGSAQGILSSKVLSLEDRNNFYSSSGFLSLIPFIILVTGLSYVAEINGLSYLFQILSVGIVALAVPLYFLIVLWSSKNRSVK